MIGQNRLKEFAKLKLQKYRIAEGKFLLEGEKLVLEGISILKNWEWEAVLGDSSAKLDPAIQDHPQFFSVSAKELGRISTQKNPDKVIAILKKQEVESVQDPKVNWFMFLDGVQDPGNVGAIYRIAEWFGFKGLVLSEGTPDPFNPKVIRGSMGASLRLKSISEYQFFKDFFLEYPLAVADMAGEDMSKTILPKRGTLVLGAEGPGVSPALRQRAEMCFSIPKLGDGESLNVAVAAGIFAYELARG